MFRDLASFWTRAVELVRTICRPRERIIDLCRTKGCTVQERADTGGRYTRSFASKMLHRVHTYIQNSTQAQNAGAARHAGSGLWHQEGKAEMTW